MKILADINISVKVVAGLKALGLDAVRVDAFLPANSTDAKIAALARDQKACVLTRDQDFPALLAMTNAVAPSIVNLRHYRTDSEFLVQLVASVTQRHKAMLESGAILTVDEAGIRIHQLPIRLK